MFDDVGHGFGQLRGGAQQPVEQVGDLAVVGVDFMDVPAIVLFYIEVLWVTPENFGALARD